MSFPYEYMLFCTVLITFMVMGCLIAWAIQLWDWVWARWIKAWAGWIKDIAVRH